MSDPRVLAGVESDEELIASARDGDRAAFAELWQRHARSGLTVARQFTSSLDADDLVAEAFTRIYQRVLAGGGPDGAFRPYLYTTIRNLARKWGSAARDIAVADIDDFVDPNVFDDPVVSLDRSLTAQAFRTLPERWQAVLWYTEVEGMDPQEVAPILGISANGVAALAYRAREGLRKSWLQAHISDMSASGSCRWTIERLGERARHGLTKREQARVHEHLGTCAKCSIIAEEVDEVGSRIAVIMVPLVLGGGVGGGLLSSLLGKPSAAMASASVAATAVAIPAAVFGGLAVAAALTTAVVVGIVPRAESVSGTTAPTVASAPAVSQPVDVAAAGDVVDSPAPTDATGSTIETLLPGVSPPLDDTLDGTLDGTVAVLDGTLDGTVAVLDGTVDTLTSAINTVVPALPVTPQATVPVQLPLVPGVTVEIIPPAIPPSLLSDPISSAVDPLN